MVLAREGWHEVASGMQQIHLTGDVEKVARGAGMTLIGSASGKIIFFLTQLLVSRIIGVEAFGLYALGIAAIKACEIISRLGLNVGGMRFVSIYHEDDPQKLKGTAILATGLSALSGVAIGAIFYFSSNWISERIFDKPDLADSLRWFSYSVPFVASMTVLVSLLQGFKTTRYTVYVRDLFQPLLNIAFTLLFLYFGLGLSGVIFSFTLSHVIALMLGFFYLAKLFPGFMNHQLRPIYEIKHLLVYSLPLLFIGFLHYFLASTDTLMIGMLGSARDAGIYRAASQLPLGMTIFLFACNSLYAPIIADLHIKKETLRLSKLFKATTRWVSYAVLPIFLIIVYSSSDLMRLFGKEYVQGGAQVLIILSFGQLINCITGGVGYTLTMTGRQILEFYFGLILVAFNILLNLWLIPKFGVVGAAISSSTAVGSVNLLRTAAVYKIYKMHPFSEGTLTYFSFTIIMSLFLFIINTYLIHKYNILINIVITVLSFIILYYFTKKDEDDLFLLSVIRSRFVRLLKT
jgi:O-antigen/teichoic acid export membrane protein